VWSGGSKQRHGGDVGNSARFGRTAEVGMEAEADDCDRKLGRGRRRTDRVHRVGRRSRAGTGECCRVFQYGRRSIGREICSLGRTYAEGVYTGDREGGAIARWRNRIRSVEKGKPAESGEFPGNQHLSSTTGGDAGR